MFGFSLFWWSNFSVIHKDGRHLESPCLLGYCLSNWQILKRISQPHPTPQHFCNLSKIAWLFHKYIGTSPFGHRYSVFSLTWPASMQIYWNKRKRLHKKRVQLSQDWLGTKTWPPFRCLGHKYGRHDFMWKQTIQGTQNLVTEKCSHNLRICYLYLVDTSIQGKGHFFWVPNPVFNLHSLVTL